MNIEKNLAIRNLSRNLRGKKQSTSVKLCSSLFTVAVLLILCLLHETSSKIIVEAHELKLELSQTTQKQKTGAKILKKKKTSNNLFN